jgi:uncharacterized small protein (DUF1192 family)
MSDIVNRLRFDFRDRDADEVEEMSQEIDRLRADLIAAQGYRAAAEEIAKRRGEMVDALIAERDAERNIAEDCGRSIIEMDARLFSLRAELAQRTAEVAKATAERDEARRELCHYKYRSIMDECPDANTAPQLIARNRGWDCFDAKEGQR